MANIEIILGSMFSGKSTELIRRCSTYKAINKNILIVNNSLDTRCGDEVKTHNEYTYKALKTKKLSSIQFDNIPDVIAIDEAQFFDDLYEFVLSIEHHNIVVIIAGLDGDFKRKTFGEIYKVIPLANTVTKLSSMCNICKDGTKGIFTKRLSKCEDLVCVGAKEQYVAVCRKHYLE